MMAWRGAVWFADRTFAYLGEVATTAVHAHHATQVAFALEERIECGDGASSGSGRAFVVRALARHALTKPCRRALLLYVEPTSDVGRSLEALVRGDTVLAWRKAAATLPRFAHVEGVKDATQRVLNAFTPSPRTKAMHRSVASALEVLPQWAAQGPVRAERLARFGGLSEGRFLHVFREDVGVALRPYVRWLRLRLAARVLRRGTSLTEAAHAAGFSDSAHLSGVFRKTFGLAPSQFFRDVDWVD